jgi:hypothetical protein
MPGFALYAQIADAPAGMVAGIPVNYTEALAGDYTLPDPLVLANGKPVRDAKTGCSKRTSTGGRPAARQE